jgi:hypothetical protein
MRVFMAALAFILCASPLYAQEADSRIARPIEAPPVEAGFVCTPGFTMTKTDTGYKLSGTLDTPTPGYAYDIGEAEETGPGTLTAALRLTGPDGMVAAVIDSLYINYEFQREDEFSRLTLAIEKQFNWGPGSITCSYIAPEGETE